MKEQQEMKRVLNAYSGLGGNRKNWKNVKVTAVENNEEIAAVYSKTFPEDELIIGDAHQYILENFQKFQFIWSSPPCQSHSKMMKGTRHYVIKYADMALYQEIILLKSFFKGKFVVENVSPYYNPIIKPSFKIDRHLFWTNFDVIPFNHKNISNFIFESDPKKLMDFIGIYYDKNIYFDGSHDPCTPLRNCVHPDLGEHIYKNAWRVGPFYFD